MLYRCFFFQIFFFFHVHFRFHQIPKRWWCKFGNNSEECGTSYFSRWTDFDGEWIWQEGSRAEAANGRNSVAIKNKPHILLFLRLNGWVEFIFNRFGPIFHGYGSPESWLWLFLTSKVDQDYRRYINIDGWRVEKENPTNLWVANLIHLRFSSGQEFYKEMSFWLKILKFS